MIDEGGAPAPAVDSFALAESSGSPVEISHENAGSSGVGCEHRAATQGAPTPPELNKQRSPLSQTKTTTQTKRPGWVSNP